MFKEHSKVHNPNIVRNLSKIMFFNQNKILRKVKNYKMLALIFFWKKRHHRKNVLSNIKGCTVF